MSTAAVQADSDIHITRVDQSKINQFARMNARMEDVKEMVKAKETELQNLEDASDELMLNADANPSVPYSFGEIFIHCSPDQATDMLDRDKNNVKKELAEMKEQIASLLEGMADLKSYLYAKFGDNINLEPDADD